MTFLPPPVPLGALRCPASRRRSSPSPLSLLFSRGIGAEWIILTPHSVMPEWMGPGFLERGQRDIDDDPRPYVAGLKAFVAAHPARVALFAAGRAESHRQEVGHIRPDGATACDSGRKSAAGEKKLVGMQVAYTSERRQPETGFAASPNPHPSRKR
jgi:hypothetical protein